MTRFQDQAKVFDDALATHLKCLREDAGLTVRQIAQKISSPHSMSGKIELHGRRVSVGEFIIYVEAMGKDPQKELSAVLDTVRGARGQ